METILALECHISGDMLLIYIIEDGYLKLT
ncbi:type II toxin-antitoxin system YafQ family toxin [Aliarcobacter thereius]|nr:type II toxin-antitoxin system YafQ family toxin [Aliarcobacter thereius]